MPINEILPTPNMPNSRGPVERTSYLQVVQAGLAAGQARFAREAVLRWLASYPGDLEAGLLYARALLGEGRPAAALPVLAGLLRADPEAVDVLQVFDLAAADVQLPVPLRQSPYDATARAAATLVLTGRSGGAEPPEWAGALRKAWSSGQAGDLQEAGRQVQEIQAGGVDHPLAGLLQLTCLSGTLGGVRRGPQAPLATRLAAVEGYLRRWPDCLGFMLWQADWVIENGDSTRAVALLHQAAARDVAGQVARRLWGERHPYRSLWPERLERAFDLPVPADVGAVLGWNRLPAGAQPVDVAAPAPELPGDRIPAEPPAPAVPEPPILPRPDAPADQAPVVPPAPEVPAAPPSAPPQVPASPIPAPVVTPTGDSVPAAPGVAVAGAAALGVAKSALRSAPQASTLEQPLDWALYPLQDEPASQAPVRPETSRISTTPVSGPVGSPAQTAANQAAPVGSPAQTAANQAAPASAANAKAASQFNAQSAADALDRLAFRLGLDQLAGQDGRFPVYVIFSSRSRLQAVYGAKVADLVETEMEALGKVVQQSVGWGGMVYLADTPAYTLPLGLTPARPDDPWELKLALTDLDAALGRRGARIGAVLIIGGAEIVPFHHLPNPVDDQDLDVPSDNPYATRDDNYFIPEWPVGRLPGGAGGDAHLLLDGLRRFRQNHAMRYRRMPLLRRWWNQFIIWLASLRPDARRSVGYTAAIWRNAAAAVFRPIGRPAAMHVSPPSISIAQQQIKDGAVGAPNGSIPTLSGKLGYFNLHGHVDASEWFGHRDPLQDFDGPDYPVALRPEDIQQRAQNGTLPQVVFSEACYGLHIDGRGVDQAISLKLLEAGSLAVAGSTCMAYGSIQEPLTAADLLGHNFWGQLKHGLPAGESLRQAKLYLMNEMHCRQGYLDGEDQKTLISFILYGDPLAQPDANGARPKCVRYRNNPLAAVRTVCDKATRQPGAPPAQVMASVKQVVSSYLPGMSDAQVLYAPERDDCNGDGHSCPTSQLNDGLEDATNLPDCAPVFAKGGAAKSGPERGQRSLRGRSLVTLSKQHQQPGGVHTEVARLTLDEDGKLVKLVVSR